MTFLRIQPQKNTAAWFSEIKKCFTKASLQTYPLPGTLLSGKETVAGYGSVAGVQLEVQGGVLYLYDLLYASSFDKKLYVALVEYFAAGKYRLFRDDVEVIWQEFLSSESYIKEDEGVVFERGARALTLFSLEAATVGKNNVSRERFFIDAMDRLTHAGGVELYPVDGLNSFIWDGASVWAPGDLQQILFSQKAFKGRLCGLTSVDDFCKILGNRVIRDERGVLIPPVDALGASDFKALNMQMEQFERKSIKQKPEALTIAVGKLEEISYSMARSIFDGKSLKLYSDKLIEEGLGQGQVEVAALAVSGMLEIAATSQGASLQEMTARLKDKNTLSEDAALAVASGFVKAAQEKPAVLKMSWQKKLFLALVISILVYGLMTYF